MQTVSVIVETPQGSPLKYDFDPKTGYIKLNKIMPQGMVFPFDFGFVEGTIGEDGDPLDAIVISEIKTFPGCAMDCRIIGAIKADQHELDGKKTRNDRYIVIPQVSNLYANVKELKDFPKQLIDELINFFTNYNAQAGKVFNVIERVNSKKAISMLANEKNKDTTKTKLIQLFLPIENEEGKPYPTKYFDNVKKTLINKFEGLSMYNRAPLGGRWEDSQNNIIKDKLVIYEVMTDQVDISYWEKYKKTLQDKFKQDNILVRCLAINLID